MRKELTHEWLESQHIQIRPRGNEDVIWHITPKWGMRELHPTLSVKHHKYGKDVKYYLVGWFSKQDNKQYVFPLHRVLYAWYHPEGIPAGYDVDHIDGNTLNNDIDNLQALTHKENIAKRKGPGKNNGSNQYSYGYQK